MGVNTKSFDNASDMITFSRASGGYGFTKVGYGSELVSNGDFSDGSTGWTASSATLSVVSGRLQVIATSAYGGFNQIIPANPNTFVEYSFDIAAGSGQIVAQVYDESYGTLLHNYSITAGTSQTTTVSFSTQSFSSIRILIRSVTASTFTVGSLSMREVTYNSSDPSATLKLIYHPNDVPRIEYNVDGSAKGLLVEGARTNLFTQSNLSNWLTTGGPSISTNYASSPENTQNATALIANSIDCRAYVVKTLSGSGHTFSVYAKKGENRYLMLRLSASVGQYRRYFDLQDGVLAGETGSGSASIQEVNGGWYRCSITTADTLTSSQNVLLASTNQDGTESGSVTSGVGVYLFGAQLEEGSFATSYIKTENVTATRALDVPQINVNNFINKSAGTFLATFNYTDPTNVAPNYVLGGPSNVRVFYNNFGTSIWQSFDGSAVTTFGAVDSGEVYKLAVAIKTDSNISTAKNGDIVATSTSGTALMTNIEASPLLAIGGGDASQKLNGHIKSIQYYPRRLTDAQLQELTT